MNKKINRLALAWVLLGALSACNSLNKDLSDYRKARLDEPLVLPDTASTAKIIDYYAIPPVQTGLVDEFADVPTPPSLSLTDENNLVRIQSLDAQKWVLIQLVPGQVWPLVVQFALSKSMGITREVASAGTIETEWLLKANDDSVGEKYRFMVKQGLQGRSSEVVVLQQQANRNAGFGDIIWQQQSHDKASADKALQDLAEYMAQFADPTAAVSLRAQNINTEQRLYLNVEQEPAIYMSIDRGRGLASAQYAINKTGFEVSDINVSDGVFYASPVIEEAPKLSWYKAFFSKLAFYKDESQSTWEQGEYIFSIKPSNQQGWLELTVDTTLGLDKAAKKVLLKEVKRNLT